MTVTSPFGQPASPVAAPTAPEPEQATGRSTRTVVIAAAAGVLALGVLGGVAVLALDSDDEMVAAPLPPAAVEAVPAVEPSSPPSVSLPLPTAVVQGRNVFVPLVPPKGTDADAAAGGGAAAGAVSEATVAAAPADFSTSGDGTRTTTTSSGTTSGGSSGTSAALAASEQRVEDLQAEIAALTERLADAGDNDAELRDELTGLQSQHDTLRADNVVLRQQTEADAAELAKLRTVVFEDVAEGDEGAPLKLFIDGEPVLLDLKPAPAGEPDVPNSVVLGTTAGSTPVSLTYVSVEPSPEGPLIKVRVASSMYRVIEGGVLTFRIV